VASGRFFTEKICNSIGFFVTLRSDFKEVDKCFGHLTCFWVIWSSQFSKGVSFLQLQLSKKIIIIQNKLIAKL
jgi:hypothetical protein